MNLHQKILINLSSQVKDKIIKLLLLEVFLMPLNNILKPINFDRPKIIIPKPDLQTILRVPGATIIPLHVNLPKRAKQCKLILARMLIIGYNLLKLIDEIVPKQIKLIQYEISRNLLL